MWKYAVMRTKDNDEEIVRWCESRDEAMVYGAEFFLALPKGEGIVSVEEVAIDQHRCLGDGHRRVHHVWY